MLGVSGLLAAGPAMAQAATWVNGDVFAGVSGGTYKVYANNGAFKQSISAGSGFTTGCALNTTGDFFGTWFSQGVVRKFDGLDPHANSQTVNSSANGKPVPESIVFAANGDFYVGGPGANFVRYNAAGTFQQGYTVGSAGRGTDWIDLARDQTTMFYDGEGRVIKRFSVAGAGSQLADFATLPGTGDAFALRLLAPGDGTGGLLVADNGNIKRLNGAGAVVQTYNVSPAISGWFSLNLDPNGTSFWAGSFNNDSFYRFNIATGALEIGPINTGSSGGSLFGICVKGELTAALGAVSIGNVTLNEPQAGGTATATFTVTRSGSTDMAGSVDYTTGDGPAPAAQQPTDYTAVSGTLSLAKGQTTATITVPVKGDGITEPSEAGQAGDPDLEQFHVTLANPRNVTLGTSTGIGTITDNDRDGMFSCRASALRSTVRILLEPAVANGPDSPCVAASRTVLSSPANAEVSASVLKASTSQTPLSLTLAPPALGDKASAAASVDTLKITIGTTTITASGLSSNAQATCTAFGPASLTGSSTVASISLNNGPPLRNVNTPITLTDLGVTVYLNRTITSGNSTTRRALDVETALGSVVAGESQADDGGACQL